MFNSRDIVSDADTILKVMEWLDRSNELEVLYPMNVKLFDRAYRVKDIDADFTDLYILVYGAKSNCIKFCLFDGYCLHQITFEESLRYMKDEFKNDIIYNLDLLV